MFANSLESEPWKKTFALISQCPVCNHKYESKAASLFANRDNAQFIHITCENCGSYFMAMMMTLGKGVSTVGMITDLSLFDAKRLHKTPPLSIDDLIEGHKIINELHKFKL